MMMMMMMRVNFQEKVCVYKNSVRFSLIRYFRRKYLSALSSSSFVTGIILNIAIALYIQLGFFKINVIHNGNN